MTDAGGAVKVGRVEGPDCAACGHFADWHHLGPDGRFACVGCDCSDYVGELRGEDDEP